MAKLKEPDRLPIEARRYQDRIGEDSARRPGKQCAKCQHQNFHRHQKRWRWFQVVVGRMICPILCLLYRWRCVNCGVTMTNLPSNCVPFKRYLRVEIEKRAQVYVETDPMSYRKVVTDGGAALVYDDPIATAQSTEAEKESEQVRQMSPTTPHRWISAIAASRERWQPVVKQAQQSDLGAGLSTIKIDPAKYRSPARERVLDACCLLLRALRVVTIRNPTQFGTLGSSP